MNIDKDTKVMDVLKEYPWLEDEVVKIDEQLAVIKTPFGKMMAKKFTLGDICKMGNVDFDEAKKMLDELIAKHEEEEKEKKKVEA